MVCPKCGAYVSKDAEFCELCNAKINIEKNESIISEVSTNVTNNSKFKKNLKIILSILLVVIFIFVVWFLIAQQNKEREKNELISQLTREWSRLEGENGTYIKCILDFSDDEIEYRVETSFSWLDTTIGTYDYQVIDGNTIKIDRTGIKQYNETYTITFNDDKTMMTFTPALTSIDDEEHWFNFK